MTVRCGVGGCPWISKNGFCLREFTFIDMNGRCSWIYNRNGMVRPNWQQKGQIRYETREKKDSGSRPEESKDSD